MTDDESIALANERSRSFEWQEKRDERNGRLAEWALGVFCWDGLLPMSVIWIPILANLVLPKFQILSIVFFILCPITALSIRYVIGWQRLRHCHAYVWQIMLFTVAVSALFLFEMFILNDQIANGPKIAEPRVLATLFLVYLLAAALALFPFASHVSHGRVTR